MTDLPDLVSELNDPDFYNPEDFKTIDKAVVRLYCLCQEAAEEIRKLRKEKEELVTTGQAVVDRWDSPLWKDLPHTADYIHRLRAALRKAKGESNE